MAGSVTISTTGAKRGAEHEQAALRPDVFAFTVSPSSRVFQITSWKWTGPFVISTKGAIAGLPGEGLGG